MKKLSVIILCIICLAAFIQDAKAGAGSFAAGYVIGSAGNNSSRDVSGSSGDLLYQISRINERIKDPLDIRVTTLSVTYQAGSATRDTPFVQSPSLRNLFEQALDKAHLTKDGYSVLRITRVIEPSNLQSATYWFEFIEKERVLTDDQLPKISEEKTAEAKK